MDDHRTGLAMHNDDVKPWHSRVPPGVPGAGWFVATIFVFCIFMFTGWYEGWFEGDRNNIAASASHRTTGAGNKVQQ